MFLQKLSCPKDFLVYCTPQTGEIIICKTCIFRAEKRGCNKSEDDIPENEII